MRFANYHRSAVVGLSLVLAVGCPTMASAEGLGFFEGRRVLKEADQAMAAGRHQEAVELYAKIIGDQRSKQRGHAIYQSAVASLSRQPADLAAAESFLDQLPSGFERSLQGASVPALRFLITEASKPAPKPAPPPVVPEPEPCPEVDAQEDAKKDLLVVQRQNAKMRGELARLQQELAQKEEALEKLKAVVVGGGG